MTEARRGGSAVLDDLATSGGGPGSGGAGAGDGPGDGPHGHRRWKRSLWFGLVLLVLGGLAALAALPTRQWLNQRDQMKASTAQLAELQERNAQLQTELDHLQSPQANDDVARKELGLVKPDEKALAVLPAPKITLAALPAEWPYTVIQQLAAAAR